MGLYGESVKMDPKTRTMKRAGDWEKWTFRLGEEMKALDLLWSRHAGGSNCANLLSRRSFVQAVEKGTKQTIHKKPVFNYADVFDMESRLTEEERLIVSQVRNYCADKLMPRVLEASRQGHFHREIFTEYGELGILGATIPEYECPGVSSVAYGLTAKVRLVCCFVCLSSLLPCRK